MKPTFGQAIGNVVYAGTVPFLLLLAFTDINVNAEINQPDQHAYWIRAGLDIGLAVAAFVLSRVKSWVAAFKWTVVYAFDQHGFKIVKKD